MSEELMTTRDVMEYLKISRSTIYRFIDQGKLKPIKIGEKSVRFRKSDVQALISSKGIGE